MTTILLPICPVEPVQDQQLSSSFEFMDMHFISACILCVAQASSKAFVNGLLNSRRNQSPTFDAWASGSLTDVNIRDADEIREAGDDDPTVPVIFISRVLMP